MKINYTVKKGIQVGHWITRTNWKSNKYPGKLQAYKISKVTDTHMFLTCKGREHNYTKDDTKLLIVPPNKPDLYIYED